jgi:membrane associated rhomboid family serine protease
MERLIVLQMTGIQAEITSSGPGYELLVDSSQAGAARSELERYDEENREPVAEAPPLVRVSNGLAGATVYGALLLLVYLLEQNRAFALDWIATGAADAGLIGQGEWWRVVTALCLHGDAAHLVGNVALGSLFGVLASHRFGSGLAWCGILVSGALGNAINALVQWAPHTSIGASTAVFGALGILAAHTWRTRARHGQATLVRWAPVISGVVLLSLLGTGGERTDVLAHVTGFGSGVLLGAVFASMRGSLGPRFQSLLGALALLAPILAWAIGVKVAGG